MSRRRVATPAPNSQARLEEARALTEAARHREAVDILEGLLVADPSDDQVRWAAAACWFQLEDYERAAQRFGELVERHPDFQEAADYLAAAREQLAAATVTSEVVASPPEQDGAEPWLPPPAPGASGEAGYGWAPAEATSAWSDTMAALSGQAPVGSPARRVVTIVSSVLAVVLVAVFVYFTFVDAPADDRRHKEQMEQEMQHTREQIDQQVTEQKRQFDRDARASCDRTLGKEQCDRILGPSSP